jgi:hypothetical protein
MGAIGVEIGQIRSVQRLKVETSTETGGGLFWFGGTREEVKPEKIARENGHLSMLEGAHCFFFFFLLLLLLLIYEFDTHS